MNYPTIGEQSGFQTATQFFENINAKVFPLLCIAGHHLQQVHWHYGSSHHEAFSLMFSRLQHVAFSVAVFIKTAPRNMQPLLSDRRHFSLTVTSSFRSI